MSILREIKLKTMMLTKTSSLESKNSDSGPKQPNFTKTGNPSQADVARLRKEVETLKAEA